MNHTATASPRRTLLAASLIGLTLVLGGCARHAFDRSSHDAIGLSETSVGGQHVVRARVLSSDWRFRRDTAVRLAFAGGRVYLDGQRLPSTCYAGLLREGSRVVFEEAEEVEYRAPADGPDCRSFPERP